MEWLRTCLASCAGVAKRMGLVAVNKENGTAKYAKYAERVRCLTG